MRERCARETASSERGGPTIWSLPVAPRRAPLSDYETASVSTLMVCSRGTCTSFNPLQLTSNRPGRTIGDN